LMNILVGAITVVLLTLAALASGAGFLLFSDYAIKDTKIVISLIVLFTLVMIFTSLIFAYLNFFMADERYRDLTFFDSLKLIVKAGIKLFSESFMAGVEAYKITLICGVVAFISLIFVMKGMEILSILAIIFGVIAAIAFFFCTPPFRASLSDIYMDRAEEIYNEVIGCED